MTRYEIVFKEGDEVCFKTKLPEIKNQPLNSLGGLIAITSITHKLKEVEIKGKVILVKGDDHYVFSSDFNQTYICKKYILKPLVKPGEILFFEKKQVELFPSAAKKEIKPEPPKRKKLAFIDDCIDVAAMVVIIILSIALGFLIGVRY